MADGVVTVGWQQAVEKTVAGLGYELVDCERSARGLLVVYIDRIPGHRYPLGGGAIVTVDDCEAVTRQLQHVLEVEGCDYERLEVSSPGVDRPLKQPAHYERFAGEQVALALKHPFQGRKKYQGLLRLAPVAEGGAVSYELVFNDGKEDQVLSFTLPEVREARLVPVSPFKGRQKDQPAGSQERKKRQSNAKATAGMNEAHEADAVDATEESGGPKQ